MQPIFLFDFSNTILFAKDKSYHGSLNQLYQSNKSKVNFIFDDYFYFNEPLLAFLTQYRSKIQNFIFTTGSIQEAGEIKTRIDGLFKQIFTVKNSGTPKDNPQAYIDISHLIGKKPQQMYFVDDSLENIKAASQADLKTIHFRGDEKNLCEQLKTILNSSQAQ